MPDVLAQWMARLAGQRVLDIGCGRNKTPGALGMDANPHADADLVHNLDDVPYPFPAHAFDAVIGRHVIEHVQSPLAVIIELHRIVRPGGWVLLVAPLDESRLCHRSDPPQPSQQLFLSQPDRRAGSV